MRDESYRDFDDLSDSNNSSERRGDAFDYPPLPFRRELPDSEPYPISALGPFLSPVAQRIREIVQAPDALCGQSVLAAGVLATQAHADVEIDGRRYPLSENFLTVGESGERKSGVDRVCLKAARDFEQKLNSKYEKDLATYQLEAEAYKKLKENVLRKTKTMGDAGEKLGNLGPPPSPPLTPILIVEEPTYEGLVKLLGAGWPSIGLFSDEGGRMIGGHAMSQEQQLKTATGLCEIWDGKPIKRVRSGDGASLLYGRRVSMHLMVQPVVASQLLGNSVLASQGFNARFLTCFPKSTVGNRPYREVDLSTDETLNNYFQHLLEIYKTPLPLEVDKLNQLNPRAIKLSASAKPLWIKFHDEIERGLNDGEKYGLVRASGCKLAEHALRLAGSIALLDKLDSSEIDTDALDCGISLARFYLGESLRLVHSSTECPDIALAEILWKWLQDLKTQWIYTAKIYQCGPSRIRTAKIARKILGVLEEHGYVRRRERMKLDGAMRSEVWEIRAV